MLFAWNSPTFLLQTLQQIRAWSKNRWLSSQRELLMKEIELSVVALTVLRIYGLVLRVTASQISSNVTCIFCRRILRAYTSLQVADTLLESHHYSGGFRLGPGGTGPQILPSRQPHFLIGCIVISHSCCCLPNDEGQAPKYFFLQPPLHQ